MFVNIVKCFLLLRICHLSQNITTSFNFFVHKPCPCDIFFQLGSPFKLHSKFPLKVFLDALDVSVKQVLTIQVRCRCHLREINNSYFFVVIYHQIEFVEISMDKTILSKLDNVVYQFLVDFIWVRHLSYLAERIALNQRHNNCMSVLAKWCWDGEPSFVKRSHISEFFDSCNSREVEPRPLSSTFQIVTLGFDSSK